MKITLLGTGTSQGVPTIGCRCQVCRSKDPRDMRLRSSAMVEWRGVRVVIDAGPDFRQQMLREGVRHLDALLLTHDHKDHTGGIDDTRAFCFVDYPTIHRIQIYATAQTLKAVRHDYHYAFVPEHSKYIGVPEIDLHEVELGGDFTITSEDGKRSIEVRSIIGEHAPGYSITGYRFGTFAYLTDFKRVSDEQVERLRGIETIVINALRWGQHYSHFNVEEALDLVGRAGIKRAYLTHCSHDVGLIDEANGRLPEGVEFGYDGLQIIINE
ncbi:MAG: MBL fold metallo-hydrolase [Rikenellaceae bacterium]